MCGQEHTKREIGQDRLSEFVALLPTAAKVQLSGGEVFLIAWLDDFLENDVVPKLGRHTVVNIITNGTLLSSRRRLILKSIPRLHLTISIDGFTKETFEYIRVGAKWNQLLSALDQVESDLDGLSGKTRSINMTVMRSNFHELPLAAEFAAKRGFDINYNAVVGPSYFDENCFSYAAARDGIGDWRSIIDATRKTIQSLTVERPRFVASGLETIEEKLSTSPVSLPAWLVRLAHLHAGKRLRNPLKALARKLAHRALSAILGSRE